MLISTDISVNKDNSSVLRTDTDTVPYTIPYRVKTILQVTDLVYDYHTVKAGELLIKHERTNRQLTFDMNDIGELVVIGEDVNNYYISNGTDGNDIGDLIYSTDTPTVEGIGEMIIGNTFIVN